MLYIIKTVYCFSCLPWTSVRSIYWDMFLEIKVHQKTLKLYTSWVYWKDQWRSKKSMLCYGRSMDINIFWTYLLKISLTYFMPIVFSMFPKIHHVSWCFQLRFPDIFGGHKNRSVPKLLKSNLIFSDLFCYLYK